MPVIRTVGLTKSYGDHKAVDDLDLNVGAGQIYGFLGQNGAGKTTTIRMLLGLIRPTSGRIEIFGEDLFRNPKDILRRTGSMVEHSGFYENLTARENLLIHTRLMGVHKRNALEEALELVGLEHEVKKTVGKYSMGMKQRLGIARAIAHHPELLLLDEPTNGLDPVGIKEVRRLIRSLAEERKMTVVISSHILSEVEQLAERIGVIHMGKLLEEVSLEELRQRNRRFIELRVSDDHKAVLLLEKYAEVRDYAVRDGGFIRIYSHFGEEARLNSLLVGHGIEVSHLRVSEDRLEDYFVQRIGGGTIG
jgi:bacitracin transport system ATP-binding protein